MRTNDAFNRFRYNADRQQRLIGYFFAGVAEAGDAVFLATLRVFL